MGREVKELADIKTRNVKTGTIKSLDRASSSMHRMKENVIRSKADDIGRSSSSDDVSSYGHDVTEHYAGSSARYAAEMGAELIIRNRHNPSGTVYETAEISDRVQSAFKQQGVNRIRDQKLRTKMADAEVLGNIEEYRNREIIRRTGSLREERAVRSIGLFTGNRRLDTVARRQQEYGRRKLLSEMRDGGKVRFAAFRNSRRKDKPVRRTAVVLKDIVESTKALVSSLSVGGAAALLIVVIMVIFGAAFMMTEDGNQIVGTGDDAIVEVAKAEIGNVGGDKFWKWYGFSSRVDWCAIFCSWCADQCGYLEAGLLPKFAVVGDGANWFKTRHRWSGRGYSPKPGDFIFFDFEQDGVLDHVGIVENCDGKVVTTIEGNAGNACKRLSYVAGNSSIAGYGLMIRPAGNKARQIALKAISLAYPDAPDKAKYHGGEPTAAYAAALNRAYPNRSGWGQPSKDGASCDVFVGTCIVDSGVDKGFPRGYRDQKARLASRTDLYECVVNTSSRDVQESELKDGDICTWEKSSGTVHIWIYAGGKARQASHDKWYGRTTSVGNNLKIRGKTVIRIYRTKD